MLNRLYPRVVVTVEIREEFGEPLPSWMEVKEVVNKHYQELLEATLDKGEASAIALAIELGDVLLVVDDLKGRKEAKRLGLSITGTLGVLFSAKQRGFIPALKPCLDKLQEVDFRIAPQIVEELLRLSGEKGS